MTMTREEYTDAVALGMLISACLLTDNPKYKKLHEEFHKKREELKDASHDQ